MTANYGGNWTALFCTGAMQPHPPLTGSEHVYSFANSTGYDGQMYHYVAHDPFLRSDLKAYVDNPRLRYRRILIPLLAYVMAMGHPAWVDRAYEIVILSFIGLGVYWSCRLAQRAGFPTAFGLVFLLMPAIPVTMDRLVVDGGLAALTAGFLWYSRSPSWKLFAVLAAAALTRETGLILILAFCAHLLWRRQFRLACIFAASGLPAIAWYGYVQTQTTAKAFTASLVPLSAILQVLQNPLVYPAATPLVAAVHVADYLALAGMLLAMGMAVRWYVRGPSTPAGITAMLFALLALVLQRAEVWQNAYDYGRIFTPLLLCLAVLGAECRKPWLLAPAAMLLPRLSIQLAPQFLGIVRWIS